MADSPGAGRGFEGERSLRVSIHRQEPTVRPAEAPGLPEVSQDPSLHRLFPSQAWPWSPAPPPATGTACLRCRRQDQL